MYAYIGVVPVEPEFLSYRASYMVMPFEIGESRGHLSVQTYGIQTAMLDFLFCQSHFLQIVGESWMRFVEYQPVLPYEFFSVGNDASQGF